MAIEQKQQDEGIRKVNETYLKNTGRTLALQGGFPTLFKITDGTLEYYDGPRTYLEMLRWYMSAPKKHRAKEVGGTNDTASIFSMNLFPTAKYESIGSTIPNKHASVGGNKTRKSRSWFSFLF